MSLLEVRDLRKTFVTARGGTVSAVNGVSFTIKAGQTVGVIGESGSGKSTIGRLILRLIEADSGTITFEGRELRELDHAEMNRLRSRIQVVFQEPYESLNPRHTIGAIVAEPLIIHRPDLDRAARRRRVLEVLDRVGLSEAHANRHPRALSGGQQQRVGIARAIVTDPSLIILDEPTSSLDLSVRSQILLLLQELQKDQGLSYLFISHDLSTIEYISDTVLIMYLGQVVEQGRAADVVTSPKHPYSRSLLESALPLGRNTSSSRFILSGEIPSPSRLPDGCFLHTRCPLAVPACSEKRMELTALPDGRLLRCDVVANDLGNTTTP